VTARNLWDAATRDPAHPATPWGDEVTTLADGALQRSSGPYVPFDAGGNANASRPTNPPGANFVWFNIPSKPVNLGQRDLWEDAS
jgi:hypothetical protein